MNSAVDIMRDQQKREHLTDEQFTDLLGVHRSTWSKVKGGQRKPGLKLLRSFNQQFPHVDIFSKDISATTPQTSPDGSTGGLGKRLVERVKKWLKRR